MTEHKTLQAEEIYHQNITKQTTKMTTKMATKHHILPHAEYIRVGGWAMKGVARLPEPTTALAEEDMS